jgi:2-C-methyl-D-erythritol 4-phosphate cytidylyltransferase
MDPSVESSRVCAILVAAGSSRRMGFDKLLATLLGVPVLLRSILAFQNCPSIDEIIIVASEDIQREIRAWQSERDLSKVAHLLGGGAERHLSVSAGLKSVSPNCGIVAVHDGARPLISESQITRCVEQAKLHRAVTCARAVTETLKRCDANGCITDSVDRNHVWVMETPQVFELGVLMSAYEKVNAENSLVTDEVSAVQAIGVPVRVVTNELPNPKITFPEDLVLAEQLLRGADRQAESSAS